MGSPELRPELESWGDTRLELGSTPSELIPPSLGLKPTRISGEVTPIPRAQGADPRVPTLSLSPKGRGLLTSPPRKGSSHPHSESTTCTKHVTQHTHTSHTSNSHTCVTLYCITCHMSHTIHAHATPSCPWNFCPGVEPHPLHPPSPPCPLWGPCKLQHPGDGVILGDQALPPCLSRESAPSCLPGGKLGGFSLCWFFPDVGMGLRSPLP